MAPFSYSRATRLVCVLACLTLVPAAASAQLFGQRKESADAASQSLRMSALEDQVRQLNGQVEQLTFQLRQLEDQLRRASEDYEYRFQQLGQGGTSGTGATVQPRVTQQAPIQQVQPQVATQSSGTGVSGTGVSGQPQSLGQVPGQPLDLSSALGQSTPDYRYPGEQPLGSSDKFGSGQAGTAQANPQLALAPTGDPKDAYDLSYGYILRGEFDTAEASFRQFLAQFPNDPLAGNAQYWLGESLFARGMYRDSADAFLKGYSEYPQGAKAPESLYKLGMSLKELGQGEAACSTFAEIPRRYPKAPQAVLERARTESQKSGC